jgi:lipopolysaccharide transport system ATP-binding protein
MKPAISVQNLGKRYVLSHQSQERYTALRDVVSNGVKKFASKLRHPFVAQTEDPSHEEFWALRGLNFEIQQGDRVGIIGRNGAGKSTLLKILSRITEPTCGQIKIKGRVSSLLEVGTGFHPELTGRENIFLNGAILGMSKAEIARKFDEIVAFAEVEKFLDTPVKRYSSGMYVRLAFAVAANLEPEILIVDEVLAVGDQQFQKKCLGKMEEVGKEGRTVIFVSHSMPTVTSLCDRAILLESGMVAKMGPTSEVVMHYYTSDQASPASADFSAKYIGDETTRLLKGEIKNSRSEVALEVAIDEAFTVEMTYDILKDNGPHLIPNFYFYTASGECAFVTVSDHQLRFGKGACTAVCHVPASLVNEGCYFVGLALSSFESGVQVHFFEKNALSFNVSDSMGNGSTRAGWAGAMPGAVRPKLDWDIRNFKQG